MKMFLWEVWPPTLEWSVNPRASPPLLYRPARSQQRPCSPAENSLVLPPSKQGPRNLPLQFSELSSCPPEMGTKSISQPVVKIGGSCVARRVPSHLGIIFPMAHSGSNLRMLLPGRNISPALPHNLTTVLDSTGFIDKQVPLSLQPAAV